METFVDTMMKFASFETIVEMIYKHVIPKPKDECSKPLQLAVSFAGGYMAGVLCAVVSHPADNLVSFLNNTKEATITDVSNHSHKYSCYDSSCASEVKCFSLAGCKTAWFAQPFYAWSSPSHRDDWHFDRSTMGNLWHLQSSRWPVSFYLRLELLDVETS